jgi:hypothetical protein
LLQKFESSCMIDRILDFMGIEENEIIDVKRYSELAFEMINLNKKEALVLCFLIYDLFNDKKVCSDELFLYFKNPLEDPMIIKDLKSMTYFAKE